MRQKEVKVLFNQKRRKRVVGRGFDTMLRDDLFKFINAGGFKRRELIGNGGSGRRRRGN